jgi:hypothetical protein
LSPDSDTIAAVATPPGRGGIGVVRVSGPAVAVIAAALLGGLPKHRQAVFRRFQAKDGSILDEGIALFFPAPRSFTGEDVLELQGHGGPAVMDLLLSRVLELGARPARPGEFSERAFLNDKLDLAQAEAIADLIASDTAAAARARVALAARGIFPASAGSGRGSDRAADLCGGSHRFSRGGNRFSRRWCDRGQVARSAGAVARLAGDRRAGATAARWHDRGDRRSTECR